MGLYITWQKCGPSLVCSLVLSHQLKAAHRLLPWQKAARITLTTESSEKFQLIHQCLNHTVTKRQTPAPQSLHACGGLWTWPQLVKTGCSPWMGLWCTQGLRKLLFLPSQEESRSPHVRKWPAVPIMRMDRRAAITRVWMWKYQSSSSCKFVCFPLCCIFFEYQLSCGSLSGGYCFFNTLCF